MWLKTLLLLSCVALILGAAVPEEQEQAAPVVHILNDAEMEKFLSETPNAVKLNRVLTPLARANREEYDLYRLSWTLGSRVSGDAKVYGISSDLMWFEGAANPKLNVWYPKSGSGKIVTHVSILVEQSTALGDAYVSQGGIGQRNIEVYVLGYSTHFWKYDVNFYGRD